MAISPKQHDQIRGRIVALVLDDFVNGLGVCRSLMKDPDIVVVCLARRMSTVRFLSSRIVCIDPGSDLLGTLGEINELVEKAICYACSDANLCLLMERKEELTNFSIPFVNLDILEKSEQIRICNESKVLIPKTVVVAPDDAGRDCSGLSYPLMIKPASAHKKLFKAEIAEDQQRRDKLVAQCLEQGVEAVVAEYIPGGDETLVTLGGYAFEGEILSSFTGRKRSQRPHKRGVACMAEAYEIDGILEPSAQFIRHCGYTGLFQMEFKTHSETKEHYFIEANPRNWLWGYIATVSGRNIARTKFYREGLDKVVVESSPQTFNRFFVWVEAIFYNLFVCRSVSDFGLFFKLALTKRPSFALIAGLNPLPFLVAKLNMILHPLGLISDKRR